MIRIIFLILIACLFGSSKVMAQLPQDGTPWETWRYDSLFYKSAANQNTEMPYRLLKPVNYIPGSGVKYPLVVMLHGLGEGMGEACTDDLGKNYCQLKWGGKRHLDSSAAHPGFVVFPQTFGGGWSSGDGSGDYNPEPPRSLKILAELLDSLFRQYPIDLDRVYIHGLSGGGQGVWEMLIRYPGLFAAAAPQSATGNLDSARTILYNALWTIQGGMDTNPRPENSIKMMDSLAKYGAIPHLTWTGTGNNQSLPDPYSEQVEPIYTLVPNDAHSTWHTLYAFSTWQKWMYHQTKRRIKVLGEATVCPDKSKPVTMGISPGFEGYQWSKNGLVIPEASKHTFTTTDPGTYQVRFLRKRYYFSGPSEWSEWSLPVQLNEIAPTATPSITAAGPTALPGLDGSVSVTLTGPAGYDSYKWSNGATGNSITVNTPGIYYLAVKDDFKCASANSSSIVITSGTGSGAPAAPTDLNANIGGKTVVLLSWTDNSINETGFELYRKNATTNDFTFIGNVASDSTTYTDESASPATQHFYIVRAINFDGYSQPTNESSVTTLSDYTRPKSPDEISVDRITANSARILWNPGEDETGLAGYVIYLNGDSVGFNTTARNFTFKNLNSNETFNAFVKAVDIGGNQSLPSPQITFVTQTFGLVYQYYLGTWDLLPNFSNLTADETGRVNNVSLPSGVARADNFAYRFTGPIRIPVTGNYTFYTNSDDGSKLYINGLQVVDNDGLHAPQERSGSIYLNKGVYSFEVTFFEKGGGESITAYWQGPNFSKMVIPDTSFTGRTWDYPSPPSVPGTPQLTYGNPSWSSLNISWADNSNNESRFELYRAENGDFTNKVTLLASLPANTVTFSDSLLSANKSYFYRLKAVGTTGESAYSAITGLKTGNLNGASIPVAPSNVIATITGSLGILSWTDNSNNEEYFRIESSADNINFLPVADVGVNVTSLSIPNLQAGKPFYVRVSSGNISDLSAPSASYLVNPSEVVPNPPSDFQAQLISSVEIKLTWKDNSNNESSFLLEKKIGSGPYFPLKEISRDSITTIDIGETDNSYSYRLSAINNAGVSAYATCSVSVSATPIQPNTISWKLPAVSVVHNSSNTNLSNALINKEDFTDKIAVNAGSTFQVSVKLPSMVNDGMFIFNIEDNINDVVCNAYYSENSTDGNDGIWHFVESPYLLMFKNKLQKFDLDQSYSNKWVRLTFTNNSGSKIDLKEFGLYQFPLSGKAQYFLILGASIEEAAGGMTEFKQAVMDYFPGMDYEPVIFNVSESGRNSRQLTEDFEFTLDKHPHAGYVFLHLSGNDISSRRPLGYDQVNGYYSGTKAGFYLDMTMTSHNSVIDLIKSRGMIPFAANMTFRNYPEEPDQPAVNSGQNQEYGSLPYNYLVNQIIKAKTPEFYDSKTRRSRIDLYPLTLNNQSILQGDGVHIRSEGLPLVREFWAKYAFRYIYQGEFSEPQIYNEYRPNLIQDAEAAVLLAEETGSQFDVWTARILVEQIAEASIRVPLHIRLDEIDELITPQVPEAPSLLTVTAHSGTAAALSWTDNSDEEAYFEVYRATSITGPFVFLQTIPTDITSLIDSGLVTSTTYFYKIRSANKSGKSVFTDVDSYTTSAPVEIIWDGGANTSSWMDAANWSTNIVPGHGAYVKLTNQFVDSAYTVDLPENVAGIQTIEIGQGHEVTFNLSDAVTHIGVSGITTFKINTLGKIVINNPIVIEGNVELNGVLEVTAPEITFKGDITGIGNLIIGPATKVIYGANASKIFSGQYNDLIINSDKALLVSGPVQVNGKLNLIKGRVNSNNNLTLNLDEGYLSYDQSNSGEIIGRMEVKKSIVRPKYTFMGSPLKNASTNEFTKDGKLMYVLYSYDETSATRTPGDYNTGWTATPQSLPAPGVGLAGYQLKPGLIEYTGEYHNSSVVVNLTKSNIDFDSESDGWNLIANPFLSDLDWDQIAPTLDPTKVDNAIYYFDGNQHTSYVPGFPPNQGLNKIPAMQGFFIHAKESSSIVLKNTNRMNSSSAMYRVADFMMNALSIELADKSTSDKTYIRFKDYATNGFDGELDAYKFHNDYTYCNVYTTLSGIEYSINSIPGITDSLQIPLYAVSNSKGSVTLSFSEMGAFTDNHIILVDRLLGTSDTIRDGFIYTFTNTPFPENRFILNFINPVPVTPLEEPVVLYRINCGGYEVESAPENWILDRQTAPCEYLNPISANYSTGSGIFRLENNTHAPSEIFGTNRYSNKASRPLMYDFDVENGMYLVRMYFAEKPNNLNGPEQRVFDIAAEGQIIESDLDIYKQVGLGALEKEYFINVLDQQLNISFIKKIYNPQINGLEVIYLGPSSNARIALKESYGGEEIAHTNSNSSFMTIYPNPVNDYFTARIPESYSGWADIQILDINGGIVMKQNVEISNGIYTGALPVQIQHGLFILKIITPRNTYNSKIQKN